MDFNEYSHMIIDRTKQSGFFDLSDEHVCNDLQHYPPMHLCIPQGQEYRHVCPRCGKISTLTSPQITLDTA